MEFRLLGAIDITSADARAAATVLAQPKRVAILAYLALATPRGWHRRESLFVLFWPEADQSRARRALNQALYTIRQSLGEAAVLTRGDDEVSLNWEKWSCDAAELRAAAAAEHHDEVLNLYQGELLPGFHANTSPEFEQWLDHERAAAHTAALNAAVELAARAEARRQYADAIALLRRAAGIDPLNETIVDRLMSCCIARAKAALPSRNTNVLPGARPPSSTPSLHHSSASWPPRCAPARSASRERRRR